VRRQAWCIAAAAITAALGTGDLAASAGTPIKVGHGTKLTDAPWRQLARATSRRTKAPAFARGLLPTPAALAFTVTSTPPQRTKVFWSVYCEGQANDEIFTPQGTFKFRTPFTAYPPILANATKCFLTVRATPTTGTAHVVVFGY
jgi:hypothetical protein